MSKNNLWCQELFGHTYIIDIIELLFFNC